jgi:hypothetical protein
LYDVHSGARFSACGTRKACGTDRCGFIANPPCCWLANGFVTVVALLVWTRAVNRRLNRTVCRTFVPQTGARLCSIPYRVLRPALLSRCIGGRYGCSTAGFRCARTLPARQNRHLPLRCLRAHWRILDVWRLTHRLLELSITTLGRRRPGISSGDMPSRVAGLEHGDALNGPRACHPDDRTGARACCGAPGVCGYQRSLTENCGGGTSRLLRREPAAAQRKLPPGTVSSGFS